MYYDADDIADAYNADIIQHAKEHALAHPSDELREFIDDRIFELTQICLQAGEVEVTHYSSDKTTLIILSTVIEANATELSDQCVKNKTNMPDVSAHVMSAVREAFTGKTQ